MPKRIINFQIPVTLVMRFTNKKFEPDTFYLQKLFQIWMYIKSWEVSVAKRKFKNI